MNTSVGQAECTEVVQSGVVVNISQACELDSRETITTVDPACSVQEDFDVLTRNTGVNSEDESIADIAEYHAVGSSSLKCKLAFSEEKSCSVTRRVKLSARLESKKDVLCANHLDCAARQLKKPARVL